MAKPPINPDSELSTSGMIMEGLVTRNIDKHLVMPTQPPKSGNTMPRTAPTEAVRPPTPKPIDRSK